SADEHAKQLAEKWRAGLTASGQEPERIGRLHKSSEWRIYTPGSEAGLPLNILKSFAVPAANIRTEDLNQKIDATTSALLSLAGIVGDPVQSREHVFLAQLLLHAWTVEKKDINLADLITRVQTPPAAMTRIGAFDVDTFYPEK